MTNKIDLFDHYELLPEAVQKVLKDAGEIDTYEQCNELLSVLEPLGYTFEYYLDAVPYDLRKI